MKKTLFKSTAIVGFLTFISRIAGFIRDMIFARVFGATIAMEAFLVAFKIPNFMRRLFAEGSFTQAFVPILSDYKTKHSHNELVIFIRSVIGSLGTFLIILTAIGMIFSSIVVLIFAPGFAHEPEKLILTSDMLKITFPYIFSIALTALAGSVMNCFSRFSIPAITPVLLNITLISFALNSHHFQVPIYSIAWGVFIAGFIQLLFQIPFLLKLKVSIRPKFGLSHPGVQRLLKLMIPALFGASVAQISLLLDTVFASFLPTGSISWLYYSDRLNQFPLGIFGVALSTVILPHLSVHFASKNNRAYNNSLEWAIKMVFVFATPAAVALIILSGPLITTLFNYGKFSQYDVLQSQKTLIAFSIGLFSFILIKILVSAFYAQHNMKTPVKIAVFSLVCNMLLNLILIIILIPYKEGHVGLAIATSISAIINASLLFYSLKKQKIYIPNKGWLIFIIKILTANITLAVVLFFLKGNIEIWFNSTFIHRLLHILFLTFFGIVIYFIFLAILGFRKKHLQPDN